MTEEILRMTEETLQKTFQKLLQEYHEKEDKLKEDLIAEKITCEEFITKQCEATEELEELTEKAKADFIFSTAIIKALDLTIKKVKEYLKDESITGDVRESVLIDD